MQQSLLQLFFTQQLETLKQYPHLLNLREKLKETVPHSKNHNNKVD